MKFDVLTNQAITHTRHCLTGCAIGEILGMVLGTVFRWPNSLQIGAAVILAFFFGYLLTFRGVRPHTATFKEAARLTLITDTVSITSMEIVDNTIEILIPGALNAALTSFLFWWSLALSLAIAFVITVPVNRFMMSRSSQSHHH